MENVEIHRYNLDSCHSSPVILLSSDGPRISEVSRVRGQNMSVRKFLNSPTSKTPDNHFDSENKKAEIINNTSSAIISISSIICVMASALFGCRDY